MTIAAISCKRTICRTTAIFTGVIVFASIALFAAVNSTITAESFIRESRAIGLAVVVSAGAACVASECRIKIALVACFSVTNDAIAASPLAIGFATAKATIVAFFERTALATLTIFTRLTNLALIAFITGFGAIYNAIAAERSQGTVGIAAAISAIAADWIARSIDDGRQTIFTGTFVAGFIAINQAVAAIPRPITHIAIGGMVSRIPAIARCVRIVGR